MSLSPTTTKKIAGLLAKEIKSYKSKSRAFIIGLRGQIGSGKTTFIQGFAHGLGLKRRLLSPTFLILRRYQLPITNYQFLFHVDCYRLKNAKELSALSFKKIIRNPKNIIITEWADKIKKFLPKNIIWIKLDHGQKENERIININVL